MTTRLIRIIRGAAVLTLTSLCMAAGAANNAIIIGQAIDLSSPNASIGRDYVAGIKTYFDSINANGGINGRHIQYIVRDDQGKADLAVKAVAELIERDRIDYLFGGVGDASTQAILDSAAFKRSDLILFAPLSAAAQKGSRVLFWRPNYQQEIRFLFSHFNKLGLKDVGIAYQESPLNQQAYNSLSAEIRDRGMRLTGTARIGTGSDGIAAEASRLAAGKPGFVVVIADTIGTSLFLKEFRTHASGTFVAGTSLINLETLREVAGLKAVEWTVFSQVVPNPNAPTSPIQAEHINMMKKYRDEAVSSLTLEGFTVAKALAKTIQQSKQGSRSALQDLIARSGNIDLGGLSIVSSAGSNHLSSYLDIALFKKGTGLLF
ncbi:MAG: ABC-type branched-chain amino acid transport system, periplasmic component [Herminiimonas sp.]|nr:ABC-type branched-chain amino acid transport system, periplasmic component [Herminiimonas sp.]